MKFSRAIFVISFCAAVFGLTACFINPSVAASFDCKKAATAVEKLICGSTDIAELDTTLGKLYSSQKKERPDLIAAQKIWLRDTRNVCDTTECLKVAYTDRIVTLKSYGDCPVNDASLQGNWKREKAGPFEEMRFDSDNGERIFLSWLHQRPEMTGKWSIDKCVIHIEDKNSPQLEFDLQVKGLEKDILRIVDLDGNSEGSYKRLKLPSK